MNGWMNEYPSLFQNKSLTKYNLPKEASADLQFKLGFLWLFRKG